MEQLLIEPSAFIEQLTLTEQFAGWLNDFSFAERCLIRIGILLAAAVLAWISDLILKKIVLKAIGYLADKSRSQWDNMLIKHHFFARACHVAPALVLYAFAPVVFAGYKQGMDIMRTGTFIYLVLIGLFVIDAFLNTVIDIYRTFEFAKRMPIKGPVQVVKIIMVLLAFIFTLSLILEKNPSALLAGMGAMTAVLMLVFKDSILGFVAGVLLSTNNMVHIGDWIEMPKYAADGDVIDITLTTVKVQNWDKTISTIPAYALISDSFKNWRGMSQSGGRRIKRSICIDMNSIKFCTDEMLDKFKRFHCISDYIKQKQKELTEFNRLNGIDESEMVNGRRFTNIGTFRAYIAAYLRNHPMVNMDMTFLVRHLEPTVKGLPIQIYVFCKDKKWTNYEDIQADIFDHILAVIPEFELRPFQEPAGADFNSEFFFRSV